MISSILRNLLTEASSKTSSSSLISKFSSVKKVKSSSETVGVGTLIAIPSSLPLSSGITSPTAVAAPVLVGIIESAADLALNKSEWLMSNKIWSLVYACVVIISPSVITKLLLITLARGARQLVVQEAFEIIKSLSARVS